MTRSPLAGVTLFLLVLTGCSGGGSDGEAEMPQIETAPAETAETDRTTSGAGETTEAPEEPGDGGPLRLEEVASGLTAPVHAAAAPGEPDRLYVVEQVGRIVVLEDGEVRGEPFLDIAADVRSGGEQGLLSVAFHPDYEANGLFYVNYTNQAGDTRVQEFERRSRRSVARRTLLAVDQPYPNHNGGQLAFGLDGLLYVGMGDGGAGGDPENRAQDPTSRLGKLLRLDVDDRGADWEMVAYGLRNPWRFSFDRLTGDLWIGDVGQDAIEEIDFVPARRVGQVLNFGWDVFEGTQQFEDKEPAPGGPLVEPISQYTHEFGCSVTGGFVYRGRNVSREARGRYFYGDYCSGRVWSLARWEGEVSRRGAGFRVPSLTSFAEDLDGELYLVSAGGSIYRLARGS
ncbi:MAG TPA: PQQ-dependent sugar dehydrogenase [Gaiellaceae bacterium]|nr:PQQ-dependent sugar dehydrogenase [Gaiellaceae bacterium]